MTLGAADVVFWVLVLWIAYVYAGYPALVHVIGRLRQRLVRKGPCAPAVTILIPAFNEEKGIRRTLENKLELEYPAERLEIIVISDGSTDATDRIVAEVASESEIPLTLLRQSPRQGKSAALNRGVATARGEILVFSDANSVYRPDALANLMRNFADPSVGYVTGKMIYANPDGSVTGDGCSTYMRYENRLRADETRAGSVVGVDGGIDAMRQSLYEPLAPDQLPDFVLPLGVVAKRYRVVYEPEAVLTEPALADAGSEYRMRVRVTLRALWAVWDMRRLLNPFVHGWYSWQLLSHKVLRYFAFVPLVGLIAVSAGLARHGLVYEAAFLTQIVFYAAALLALFWPNGAAGRLFALPCYFVIVNAAAAHAAVRFLQGDKVVVWQPRVG